MNRFSLLGYYYNLPWFLLLPTLVSFLAFSSPCHGLAGHNDIKAKTNNMNSHPPPPPPPHHDRQKHRNSAVKKYRPLHHAPRRSNPLAVERDLPQTHVLGSDESGTGCLAGPIVTATCCIMNLDQWTMDDNNNNNNNNNDDAFIIPGVLDGKRLTQSQRLAIYHQVLQKPDIYKWTTALRTARQVDESPSVWHAIEDCFEESIHKMVSEELNLLTKNAITNQDSSLSLEEHVFSIVDGPCSPKGLSIPSRPWVGGDNVVYTVALASIMAQVTRELWMEQHAAEVHPEYGFHIHYGYYSPQHEAALIRYGPIPSIHRMTCKSMQRYMLHARNSTKQKDKDAPTTTQASRQVELDRSSFLKAGSATAAALVAALTLTVFPPHSARAMYTDSKTGIRLPDMGEIASAVPIDWTNGDWPNPVEDAADRGALSRLDTSNDATFYRDPRFVEHVDEQAVQLITRYISKIVLGSADNHNDNDNDRTLSILDLCSSWTSHLSPLAAAKMQRVAGLGMNAQELMANPSLTEWVVQDLNENPILPYHEASFDIVLCQLSIDYLTKPLQVCREMGRVLKTRGSVHVLFSNRLFLQKAVALWTGADDIDHAYTVASYFHFCQQEQQQPQKKQHNKIRFVDIQAQDLSVRNQKSGRIIGDPLYVVKAVKA